MPSQSWVFAIVPTYPAGRHRAGRGALPSYAFQAQRFAVATVDCPTSGAARRALARSGRQEGTIPHVLRQIRRARFAAPPKKDTRTRVRLPGDSCSFRHYRKRAGRAKEQQRVRDRFVTRASAGLALFLEQRLQADLRPGFEAAHVGQQLLDWLEAAFDQLRFTRTHGRRIDVE